MEIIQIITNSKQSVKLFVSHQSRRKNKMLIALVGTYNDKKLSSIRGNGKTLAAVFLAYQEYKKGKKVYTNFFTNFSKKVTLNELVELFKDEKLTNSVVILDEIQIYLMNSGVKAKTLKEIINLFIAQTRKQNVDILYTTQRFKNAHIQLRTQTDIILIPVKYHATKTKITEVCYLDNCKRPHIICIFNVNTQKFLPYMLNPETIGKMYNSNEIVFDEFITKTETKK